MILNKGSFERGFAHASVYKCEVHITYSQLIHLLLSVSLLIFKRKPMIAQKLHINSVKIYYYFLQGLELGNLPTS